MEIFIEYVLEKYCKKLIFDKKIDNYSIASQKHYVSDIASNVEHDPNITREKRINLVWTDFNGLRKMLLDGRFNRVFKSHC